jgi:hypothetical protein
MKAQALSWLNFPGKYDRLFLGGDGWRFNVNAKIFILLHYSEQIFIINFIGIRYGAIEYHSGYRSDFFSMYFRLVLTFKKPRPAFCGTGT